MVYGHFWLVSCGICFLVLHGTSFCRVGKSGTQHHWSFFLPSIFLPAWTMDPPFDATYGGFLDDDFVMQPLEAKAGITTFAGPAGVVYETIPPPPGAAFPMPAVEPPFYPSFNASTPQHFGPSGPWHHQGHTHHVCLDDITSHTSNQRHPTRC